MANEYPKYREDVVRMIRSAMTKVDDGSYWLTEVVITARKAGDRITVERAEELRRKIDALTNELSTFEEDLLSR